MNKDFVVGDHLEPIKISVKDYVYYVNEKTNIVGCKMYFDVKGPECVIKILKDFDDCHCTKNGCYYVTAEAHLDPVDDFNAEIGMRIVRAKAESMAYKMINNMFNRIQATIASVLFAFNKFDEKTKQVIEHNEKYLNKF